MPEPGGHGGAGGAGGEPGGLGGPGGAGGPGGDYVTRPRGWERVAPWLLGIAFVILAAVIIYTGFTIHQHNADLTCMKQGFDQVLNELLHHQTITAPPDC